MSIVLSVGTGHIGSVLAASLLDQGLKITVINRDAKKVKNLADRGARIVEGQIDDPKVLDMAFDGAKSLFWLIPVTFATDYLDWALKITKEAVATAKKHKLEKIVYISSNGAQGGKGIGFIEIHFTNEQYLFGNFPNVASLRAGSFMENLLRDLQTVVASASVYTPLGGRPPYPVVATDDIANKAAAYLTNDWTGHHIVGVHGPQYYTTEEIWAVVSKVIGVEVKVVSISLDQLQQNLKARGFQDHTIKLFVDMYKAFISGVASVAEPRSVETTTQTTLRAWAESTFKPAYESAKAQQKK